MKKQWIIPMNFMESGYVLNGAVSIRNAVEGCILALLAYFFCKTLPLPSGTDAIAYYIFIISPFLLIGAAGVQGDPLSVFIMDFFKWSKRRKPCFYSTHGEAYTQEAAELVLDAPQMRDLIADVVDSLKAKMATDEIEYVEGETFRFADDPEQAALKQAQEELLAKREEAKQKESEAAQAIQEEAKTVKLFVKPEGVQSVDAEQVAQMLILDELEWEEETANGEEKA